MHKFVTGMPIHVRRFLLIWLGEERIPILSNANIVDMTKLEAIVFTCQGVGVLLVTGNHAYAFTLM